MKKARWAATAAAMALAGIAAGPVTASAAATPAGPRVPRLAWHSCDGGFECATARVPLDYRHPRGRMISIAVIRHKASGRAGRAGSLFINSGGPAEQIQPFVASFPAIPAVLRARFDIITFDPRGFGFSSAVRCFPRLARARAGGFGLFWAWNEEACARWPRAAAQDRYTGPWNRYTANQILVIGNTVDPATPYQDAVAMARDLARARLLTVDGFGHTEFANPSTCATSDEIRYLTSGVLPRRGAVCKQNAMPFPGPGQ